MQHGHPVGTLSGLMRRHSARIALLALLALLPGLGGCYGRFPITKAVYKFNGSVSDNGVVQNVIFWVLIILPVYELAQLGDAVIFNLIEYWTGEKIDLSRLNDDSGAEVALTPSADGGELRLTVSRNGKLTAEARFVRIADAVFEVRDSSNRVAGMVIRNDDGSFRLTDAEGRTVRTIHPHSAKMDAAG